MPRVEAFQNESHDALTWGYPQAGAILYEKYSFILGSLPCTVETLTLNGEPVPLLQNTYEKAFAFPIQLEEGVNTLVLQSDLGHLETRDITRQALWQMPQQEEAPLVPMLPHPERPLRLLVGESFHVEVRAVSEIQALWLNLVDEMGKVIVEAPLRCDDAFHLNPRAEGHGSKTAVFGQLIHTQDHPPISKEVRLFHGRITLNAPLLHRLPDNYPLRFRYSFQTRDGASGIYDTPQQLTVWKHPRTVEVTASCSAFYHGDSSRGRRLALMPPSHALMPVVGLVDVNAFLIRSHHNAPYFLRGGKPQNQAGVGISQYLEALETCESPTAWTTLFKLIRPCGAVLDADTQGVHLTLMNTTLSLTHQQYDYPYTVKWQFQERHGDALLSFPVEMKGIKGVQSHWTKDGLQVEILKRPLTLVDCRIMLDAGHGGLETGTHALNGLPEKLWTLELAKRIQLLLHEAGVSQVSLSREADVSLSLQERQAFAQDVSADICVSLHANALPDTLNPQERSGVSVHTYTPWSSHLGDALQHALTQARPNDGRFMSNFAMTRLPTCQSVLIEYGYFIHPSEYNDLLEEDTLWHLAHQTVKGLRDSFC